MKVKIILAVIFVALIAAFFIFDLGQYFSLEYLKEQKDALSQFYDDNPIGVSVLFFLIYVVFTALALPAAAILTLAAGAIFGFWKGVLLVSFASTIGATVAFLLTRYLFQDAIQKKFGTKLETINKGIEKEGAFYVFGLRLVPIFPFFMINSLLALTKIKTTTFYWASQLGMLVGTAVFVNAGTQLAQISSTSDILSPGLIISFVLLGIFPIIAKYALAWLKRAKAQPESPES